MFLTEVSPVLKQQNLVPYYQRFVVQMLPTVNSVRRWLVKQKLVAMQVVSNQHRPWVRVRVK